MRRQELLKLAQSSNGDRSSFMTEPRRDTDAPSISEGDLAFRMRMHAGIPPDIRMPEFGFRGMRTDPTPCPFMGPWDGSGIGILAPVALECREVGTIDSFSFDEERSMSQARVKAEG
jgi:hypothetical protein